MNVEREWADPEFAAETLAKAKRGDASSQRSVAIGLTDGSDGFEKDEGGALEWFRRAARQGDAQALYNLGWLYEYGEGGPADSVEAERLYRLAAMQGHPEAREALGWPTLAELDCQEPAAVRRP